jgi:hypothetical protein
VLGKGAIPTLVTQSSSCPREVDEVVRAKVEACMYAMQAEMEEHLQRE